MNRVDQHALVVALYEAGGQAVFGQSPGHGLLDLAQRGETVLVGLASAQQIEVGTVENRTVRPGLFSAVASDMRGSFISRGMRVSTEDQAGRGISRCVSSSDRRGNIRSVPGGGP